jgi:lipopolysaccharide transport system ATP-binding protein
MKKNKRIRNKIKMNDFNHSTSQPFNKLASQQLNNSTSDDVAIRVDHVSKKYCKVLKRSMLYGVKDIGRNAVGLSSHSDQLRKDEFWAVDDVSFEVRKGEPLGIIGPNGSGKTTLLKMLNGIFWPDKGRITIRGRVGALIEVGAGFHPMLTGRENIYVNAAILGMNKEEIDEKFDDIIEFADIGDFLDMPVKNYSSGMFVRLGFAVAAHCEPDILLVDEVLAVGDVGFRAKCYNWIAELMSNCAVVLVSHHMPIIGRICSECLVLNNGHFVFQGPPEEAVQRYTSQCDIKNVQVVAGSGEARIEGLEIYSTNYKKDSFRYGDPLTISFDVTVSPKYKSFLISLAFVNQVTELVAQCHSGYNNIVLKNKGKSKTIRVTIPKLLLNPGRYLLNIIIFDGTNRKHLVWYRAIKKFNVVGNFIGDASIQLFGLWNIDDI